MVSGDGVGVWGVWVAPVFLDEKRMEARKDQEIG